MTVTNACTNRHPRGSPHPSDAEDGAAVPVAANLGSLMLCRDPRLSGFPVFRVPASNSPGPTALLPRASVDGNQLALAGCPVDQNVRVACMRVRVTKNILLVASGSVERAYAAGTIVDVPPSIANILIAVGQAEPVVQDRRSDQPTDRPNSQSSS